jgi:phenylacetate-CoA ligase
LPHLESLDRDELRALQERKLGNQLARIRSTNPFYRDHWAQSGVSSEAVQSLDAIRELPFVTKDHLLADQTANPPYGARLGIDERDVHEITMTSGTSGKEKEVHAHSLADTFLRGELTAIGFAWAGLGSGDIGVAHVGANNAASLWTMVRGIRTTGRMPYLTGHASADERLDLMQRFGVNVMFAMPSGLTALATRCEELDIRPEHAFPNLWSIMTSGESWPVEWVERMEQFWGARIHEVYGSTQTNAAYGAACCEFGAVRNGQRAHNHLFEWTTYYEVIDPVTLEPTEPGERGELVLTHLDKEASPLVRFRTGDLVRWYPAGTCPCGRWLRSLETGTVGRVDDMLKIRGQNIWTSSVDAAVLAHPEVDELQVRVSVNDMGRERIEMRVGLRSGIVSDPSPFLTGVAAELKELTDLWIDVVAVDPLQLPHYDSPDLKPRRWTDDRHAGLQTAAGGLTR